MSSFYGQNANGEKYRSFACSNRESGCDFFETEYGDLTPPGILITEKMTVQDIEKLKETRRNRNRGGVVLPQSPFTPFDQLHYRTGKSGFAPPFPPFISNEPQEGSADNDNLPF